MEQMATIWTILYWGTLAASGYIGFIYFRDLGDITQLVVKVKRENMLRFIRNEYKVILPGIAAGVFAAILHFTTGAGEPISFWLIMAALVIFYGFTWVWVHIGLRHQQDKATYYSVTEARKFVAPEDSVIVLENNGHARAHPDYEIWRPHLAGNDKGLGGENVIITYCSMTHLGLGYKPEIEGEKLNLEVLAQHGNNLIMRDNNTGEPIQQLFGNRERDDRKTGPRMQEWPTFRMTFRGFEKAYPDGEVFLNRPSKNPFIWLVDFIVNTAFVVGLANQYRREEPVMDNLDRPLDRRLPLKTFVWGFNVGDDYTCYTEDFVKAQEAPLNVKVGGRDIVVDYDNTYESVGIWYNDSGKPVFKVDFFGESDQGKLERVETVKAGGFWHVWSNYFPETDFNRETDAANSAIDNGPKEDIVAAHS
jgi:hypothetical protein